MSEQLNEFKSKLYQCLDVMHKRGGADLFVAPDFHVSMKKSGDMVALTSNKLKPEESRLFALSIMNATQKKEFEETMEANFAIVVPDVSRFRVNVMQQQGCVTMVIRAIASSIPTFESLKLPNQLKDVAMAKRGLALLVGATGSGKSTTLAAMIDYRNTNSKGHIVTIEDPVEYTHISKGCLVSHREVGIDTINWHNALKNTLRQSPDVILIGEIRDAETMEHAIEFSETGHLCLGTLHANSANQAIERIINFFPHERHQQIYNNLALNIKGVISQRLVKSVDGGRRAAIEILTQSARIADCITKGNIAELKEVIKKSREVGMQTFDQALFDLYEDGSISLDEALRNADNQNELKLDIKLNSKRGLGEEGTSLNLSLQ